ncbi:MAG: hypothetical protein SPF83_13315, partial [Butyricimonas virosa]
NTTRNSSSYTNSGSRNPLATHCFIISPVPVPIRSIYPVKYIGSASNGFAGIEVCGSLNFAGVNL